VLPFAFCPARANTHGDLRGSSTEEVSPAPRSYRVGYATFLRPTAPANAAAIPFRPNHLSIVTFYDLCLAHSIDGLSTAGAFLPWRFRPLRAALRLTDSECLCLPCLLSTTTPRYGRLYATYLNAAWVRVVWRS
jgi:hypothetical protein